jgi:small subunit ribosomal protein S8
MMTDPLADLLTRIRNANRIERPTVDIPASRLKCNVCQVLKDEGFILGFDVGTFVTDEAGHKQFQTTTDLGQPHTILRVFLKYGPEGERVIRNISRMSKPGCRVYKKATDLRPVLDGQGISILSTSKGVMSDRQARTQRLGGELLCNVW